MPTPTHDRTCGSLLVRLARCASIGLVAAAAACAPAKPAQTEGVVDSDAYLDWRWSDGAQASNATDSPSTKPEASAGPQLVEAAATRPEKLEYPEIAPARLGTVKGRSVVFKHAYIVWQESTPQLQAFTDDAYATSDADRNACPTGVRSADHGHVLQIAFDENGQTKRARDFSLESLASRKTAKAKVTKASATIQGDVSKPATKVQVDLKVSGPGTKLKGTIEAVVCPKV